MSPPSPVFRKKPSLSRQLFDGEGGWLCVLHAPAGPEWEPSEEASLRGAVRLRQASYRLAEDGRVLTLLGCDEEGGEETLEELAAAWVVEHAAQFGKRPRTTITHALQRLVEGDVPALEVLVEGAPASGERFRLRARYAVRGKHRLTLAAFGPASLVDAHAADVANWFDSAIFDPR